MKLDLPLLLPLAPSIATAIGIFVVLCNCSPLNEMFQHQKLSTTNKFLPQDKKLNETKLNKTFDSISCCCPEWLVKFSLYSFNVIHKISRYGFMIYTSNVIFCPRPNFLDSFVPRPEIESFGWKELEFELTQELRIRKRLNERRLSPGFRADVSLNVSKHRAKGDK